MSIRIGHGYDVHRLVEGRKLIVGGVEIPYEKGLLGHSDADVLCHAVADALLGAAGLRDIGYYFPDSDEKYKNVSSLVILRDVARMLSDKGMRPSNVDSTLIAQKPKFSPYIEEMKKAIADALSISESSVNVKATTEENLGFTGRGEGISAHAVCIVEC